MSSDLHLLSSYQFDLPEELIAQHPCNPRDASRLMVIDRQSGNMTEMRFSELSHFLNKGDSLVFNNTKVIPARLIGTRETGGMAEIFLTNRLGIDTWEALARPGKKIKNHDFIFFGDGFKVEILDTLQNGSKLIKFHCEGDFDALLKQYGQIPLPQYIKRDQNHFEDEERYQTVFAKEAGAVAAPTAGLHFTEELLYNLNKKDVLQTFVTLHVGVGTFRPVQVNDIRNHEMHHEKVIITDNAASILNARPKDKRQITVGTTCCRSLESSAGQDGIIVPGSHETNIFIYPGYQFKYVNHLLTNFHLPGSSLLMLVSAFAGYELIREAYKKAVMEKYRFFSYGDAMLIM